MPRVNVSQFTTRTITVPLTFEEGENCERKTEDFAVKYRVTPALMRQVTELEEVPDWNMAKSLALVVTSIPDITNGDGGPLEITEEHLADLGAVNCREIYFRLFKDINPTQAPATSTDSRSTSATEPAAQS